MRVDGEKLYTLNEARAELVREECRTYGHDYHVVVVRGDQEPVTLSCQRCGKTWPVEAV